MNPNLTYQEIVAYIKSIDPVQYAKTRNHLSGAVSKLSPYITRGVISLPAIRDIIYQSYTPQESEKFVQELAWREYFQKVFTSKGEAIFSDLRFTRDDWQHQDLVTAVVDGTTSITTIDSSIADLYQTGYMHNHARMWTAMLACNVAKAHWSDMSRWLYYHLIDGDLASNTLSWQWVAGTSINKQYVANQELINACSDSTQTDTYLDIDRDRVSQQSVPDALQATTPFAYTTDYPDSDQIPDLQHKSVCLYHPWSIDPLWRIEEEGVRIFVIEPQLFDRFPVSPLVMDHLISLVRTHVPEALIFVGAVSDLPGIETAQVYSKAHPTTTHFPGTKDQVAELFPAVQGYFQSFFKFWQACQKGG